MRRICIVLCTYNGERFLSKMLDSLCAQTRKADWIVAYDDGSTDSTLSLLQSYGSKLPLQIFAGNENRGHRAAFDRALGIANSLVETSDLIALADQDDEWLPKKLEILEREIGKSALVFGDAEVVDADGNTIASSWQKFGNIPPSVSLKAQIAGVNNVTGCTSLFRAEILRDALPIPDGVTVHDRWMAMFAERRGGIRGISDKVIEYRLHGSNAVGGRPSPRMSETLRLQEIWVRTILQNAERIPLNREEIRFAEKLLALHIARKRERVLSRFLPWIFLHRNELFPPGNFKKRFRQILFSCVGLPLAKKLWGKS